MIIAGDLQGSQEVQQASVWSCFLWFGQHGHHSCILHSERYSWWGGSSFFFS
jgi:hypothetical protein